MAESQKPSSPAAPPLVQERHADCAPTAELQQAHIQKIIDGDTFSLNDGKRVRLIGVNAPEVRHRGKPGEPLGEKAKKAVQDFFGHDRRVYLETGSDAYDHYRRMLAHAYRPDGASLAAFLLERGLALQILVVPNIGHRVCMAAAEARGRHAGRGLWSDGYFAPRPAAQLQAADTGFRRITGKIVSATASGHLWWLELDGPVVLRMPAELGAVFGYNTPEDLKGLSLTARGWLGDRSGSRATRRGFKPLVLHTGYLEAIP